MEFDDDLTSDVIGIAMRIHRDLGPGLFESVYEKILAQKLTESGHTIVCQKAIDIDFEGAHFANAFKIDLLVNDTLVVELKSVELLQPVHSKQLMTYLKLMKRPVGLLINFGGATLKEGIRRLENHHL